MLVESPVFDRRPATLTCFGRVHRHFAMYCQDDQMMMLAFIATAEPFIIIGRHVMAITSSNYSFSFFEISENVVFQITFLSAFEPLSFDLIYESVNYATFYC